MFPNRNDPDIFEQAVKTCSVSTQPHAIQTEPLAGRHAYLSLTANRKPSKLRFKHNRIGVFTDVNEILRTK